MRPYLFLILTLITASSLKAETDGEKSWRLRAEILERQLELAQMELASHGEAVQSTVSAYPAQEEPVAVRLIDRNRPRDTDALSMAQIAPASAEEVSSAKDSDSPKSAADQKREYMGKLRKWRTVDKEQSPPFSGDVIVSYQMLKPSTRVFFDTGRDEPNEPDFFKNGNFGAAVDLLTIRADYYVTESISLGGFVGGGLAAASENTFNAAVVAWNMGVSLSFEELPISVEFGFMQGVSASDNFDDHFDSALFVGLSTNPSVASHRVRLRSRVYEKPEPPPGLFNDRGGPR